MKNILLLTDFSNNALNAIHYALQFFKDRDCKFWLLHVKTSSDYISDELISDGTSSVYDALLAKVKQELHTLIEELRNNSTFPDLKIEALIDYDELTNAVNQVVKSKNIDMIIMGSNGVTGAKEVLFGSHTVNIAKHATIPTLVIPEKYQYQQPKTLFLPLHETDPLEGEMMTAFASFVNSNELKVKIVRAGKDDSGNIKNQDIKKLDALSPQIDYSYEYFANTTVLKILENHLTDEKVDMLCLFLHKESFLHRLFKKSSTHKIADHLTIPLLIFHY